MKIARKLALLILVLPQLAIAEGFFDPEITEKGYFDEDRASFPVKNPTGNTTSRRSDSFDLNSSSSGVRDSVLDELPRNMTGTASTPPPPPTPALPKGGAQDTFQIDPILKDAMRRDRRGNRFGTR
jgi:hypothetical protein